MRRVLSKIAGSPVGQLAYALTEDSSLRMLSYAAFRGGRHTAANLKPRAPAVGNGAITETSPRIVPGTFAGPDIPKIIFQTWKTRTGLPSNYDHWSRTLRELNPDFQHLIWHDADNREHITQDFPWFLPTYDSYPKEIFRADIVRYFFLLKFGGFYVDMDTECLLPLTPLTTRAPLLLCRMGRDEQFPHSIPNAAMASSPGQAIWLLAISIAMVRAAECKANGTLRDAKPEYLTGPILLRDTYELYRRLGRTGVMEKLSRDLPGVRLADLRFDDPHVLPETAWFPINWNNPIHQSFRNKMLAGKWMLPRDVLRRLFPASYLVSYWTHSW